MIYILGQIHKKGVSPSCKTCSVVEDKPGLLQ